MPKAVGRFSWVLLAIVLGGVFILRDQPMATERMSPVAPLGSFHFSPSTLYRVAFVVDGDTVDIDVNGENVRVRLIGINTPEVVDPRKPVECFGREASRKAGELLASGLVRVETDPTQGSFDKYGRTLAYLYLPDGTSLNKEMIAEGYAYEYTYRYPYKYQVEFKEAERLARERGFGLWAPGVCEK